MGSETPAYVRGHTPVRHGPGDWRCTCGLPLSGGPAGSSRAGARDLMHFHQIDLRIAKAAQKPPSSLIRYERAKQRVFDHYGRTCQCCGSAGRNTIDHVAGGGNAHRAALGVHGMYYWLVANDFPEGFQTLCAPCNKSKGNRGRCIIDHRGANRPMTSAERGRRWREQRKQIRSQL